MQPDTTPLKLVRDLTAKMNERRQGTLPSDEQSQNDKRKKAEHVQAQATEDVSPITDVSDVRSKRKRGHFERKIIQISILFN